MDITAIYGNLNNLITLLAVFLIASIILILILTTTRTFGGSTREEPPPTGVVGVEDEERPPTPAPLSNISLDLMRRLDELELMNFNNLVEELNISREELSKVLNNLVSQRYVEVSGDLVMLTDRGRKMILLMREKSQL